MHKNTRYQQAKKVTLIGAIINTFLGIIKVIGGYFFHSHALFADGIHSFSDLIVDGMVLFASKYGSQDADQMHPYGHQRIETATTLFLALMLVLAGAGIAWDSLNEIFFETSTTPRMLALPIAFFSIVANEILFHYTRLVGTRVQSPLLIANAWHHRSDAAASIVVLMGLIGSVCGISILDPLAAVIVGCLIIKMGISYGWNSVKELVDTGIDPALLEQIEKCICKIDGVLKIHQLRSRMMGQDIFIDVHILVLPMISVSEGHFIAQRVHRSLMSQIPGVKDVTVHIDPEDDETSCPSCHLPSRTHLEEKILKKWQTDFPLIQSCLIHYIDGKIMIDLIISPDFTQWSELKSVIKDDLTKQTEISSVRLLSLNSTLGILPS